MNARACVLCSFLLPASISAQTVYAPVYPESDGDVSVSGNNAGQDEIFLSSSCYLKTAGWIGLSPGTVPAAGYGSALLVLHVRNCNRAGSFRLFALSEPLPMPETEIAYDELVSRAGSREPFASVRVCEDDTGTVLRIDISAAMSTGMHGIVLIPDPNLEVAFDSQKGGMRPFVLVRNGAGDDDGSLAGERTRANSPMSCTGMLW